MDVLCRWLIIIIYIDSFLFVFVTALFKDIGLNDNPTVCDGAILLCLICYMTTKIVIYLFLVEKAVSTDGTASGCHNNLHGVVHCQGEPSIQAQRQAFLVQLLLYDASLHDRRNS